MSGLSHLAVLVSVYFRNLFKTFSNRVRFLNLVELGDVDALHEVLELLDCLSQPVDGDFIVLDDAPDLQLHDSVGEGDEFGWQREKATSSATP